MKHLITIFTPTYNRAHLLPRLYDSLKQQDVQNFEWVIVDDGSQDETEEIIAGFINEANIPIKFHRKANEGKHIAINWGVQMADGDLFFIVDSDDYLLSDATKLIQQYYLNVCDRDDIAGVSFRRGESATKYIGTQETFSDIEATAIEFRCRYGIEGDMAEVFKTKILREYPFPKIYGEKFCTEALVWNRIALRYKLLWTSRIVYIGEYLKGGLSDNSVKLRKQSPNYAMLFYSEFTRMPISFGLRVRATINYWRFARYSNVSCKSKWEKVNWLYSLIALPVSWFFIIKD